VALGEFFNNIGEEVVLGEFFNTGKNITGIA
jgi:hypothetical protein